jgi:hypothetical protein
MEACTPNTNADEGRCEAIMNYRLAIIQYLKA